MNGAMFGLCGETRLVPTLREGDVVVLDNLPRCKSPAASKALRDIGAWLRFRAKPSTARLCCPSNLPP